MDFIRLSIERPVAVIVGVLLIVLFGLLGLKSLPYQLSPSVVEPVITVTTRWIGATPYEVERDVIEEQEKVLKGIPGLTKLESEAFNSQGTVTLTFQIGTDVDEALLRVSNKLNEVPSYPDTADRPIISATGASTSPVIWMILRTVPGNERSIFTYKTFFENDVRQHLERVHGVADLFMGGGQEKQMHVVVDPDKLAGYGLTVADVIRVVNAENANVSAGNLGVGRRDYRVRALAEYKSPEDILKVVLVSDGQRKVTVGDVATVRYGYEKQNEVVFHNGQPGMAVGIKPEPGANILDMTNRVEAAVRKLNDTTLKKEGLRLEWVYDQRPYIAGAIDLMQRNILLGGILAVVVLLVFLRSLSSTLVVATAIPISVIGSFMFLNAFGRTLNVVSLAGISFAVGMLVDSAIVVLENIDRHRKMGKPPFQAAYDGAKEVWGAILASTLTTIAVFLPVVFVEQEAGQLFKDIAIAVTAALCISLFVSISVIPMFSRTLFRIMERRTVKKRGPGVLGAVGGGLQGGLMALVRAATANWATRILTVVGLTAFSVVVVWALFPKMEYLPQGNRNLVINILVPPPGLSLEERREIGEFMYSQIEPRFRKEVDGLAGVQDTFYVGAPQIMLMGAISTREQQAGDLVPMFRQAIAKIPGMFGISYQAGIFQTSLGGGRSIDLDISGPDINGLVAAGGVLYGKISQEIPGSQIRPVPSLELLYPEVRLIPDRDRVRAVNMTASEFGQAVDVFMDGRIVGEFKPPGEKKIDLVVKAEDRQVTTPEELLQTLLVVPGGRSIPVSSLSSVERTYGLPQVRHLERERTITLQITPPKDIPIEQAIETIENKLVPEVEKMGLLEGKNIRLSGTADKLVETRQVLQWDFLLAAAITYLLMSALFGNFIYPLAIMFTVPLAAAGGFIGLSLVHIFVAPQPLDILTMLGFVILIGVVVNNAILIVYQALNNVREGGMEGLEAVRESVKTRLRPIYMSATTSFFGMLPLVIAPGPGSELYRGLGAVLLGGIALSTIFTIFVIPSLMGFLIKMEKPNRQGEGA